MCRIGQGLPESTLGERVGCNPRRTKKPRPLGRGSSLINAGQAISEAGVITVGTYNRSEGDKKFVVISVTDTGTGISPNIQGEIYKPFVTTKNGNGTGFGLYIVSLVMKNHNGCINMHSQIGEGTRFEMIFPAF